MFTSAALLAVQTIQSRIQSRALPVSHRVSEMMRLGNEGNDASQQKASRKSTRTAMRFPRQEDHTVETHYFPVSFPIISRGADAIVCARFSLYKSLYLSLSCKSMFLDFVL